MVSSPGATLITCEGHTGALCPLRFLIMDAPSPSSLGAYIKEMQKHNVSHLVRVCGPTYKSEIVEKAGIEVHHWQFDDGAPPPRQIVEQWLGLLDSLVQKPNDVPMDGAGGSQTTTARKGVTTVSIRKEEYDPQSEKQDLSRVTLTTSDAPHFKNDVSITVAVHCVAGLGRAPILVALALVEFASFDPLDAIGYIRERRRGAINNVQLNWLMKYKRRSNSHNVVSCCVIA